MLNRSWCAWPLAGLIGLSGLSLTLGTAQAHEPIWDGNKVQMQSQRLAPGVYVHVPADAAELNAKGGAAATSGGLIVGTRGALLIETMLNRRLHDQVRQLAEKAAPGKPLLYAVNTSSHGDHSFGNMFLPRQTRLIQHEHTAKFIAGHLAQDKAFMLQHFGKGRGIEPIRARAPDILLPAGGKLLIDLGERQVEIHDFGFAQTGGDLWVWDPESKTMWAGNPVIAAKPALPWLLDGKLLQTLATLQKVYDFLPADATLVPWPWRAHEARGAALASRLPERCEGGRAECVGSRLEPGADRGRAEVARVPRLCAVRLGASGSKRARRLQGLERQVI